MSGRAGAEPAPATVLALRDRLIADGLAEVNAVYAEDDPKRRGAVLGFELCRQLETREQFERVLAARQRREHSLRSAHYDSNDTDNNKDSDKNSSLDDYWAHRYGTLQVEWLLSCLKVAAWALPGDMLSGRAAVKVAEVLS